MGWFFLAAEAETPADILQRRTAYPARMLWFVADDREILFTLLQGSVDGYRLVNRWGVNQVAEIHLVDGDVITVSGPRKPVRAILEGFKRNGS